MSYISLMLFLVSILYFVKAFLICKKVKEEMLEANRILANLNLKSSYCNEKIEEFEKKLAYHVSDSYAHPRVPKGRLKIEQEE